MSIDFIVLLKAYGAFSIVYILNMVFGLYQNCVKGNESFDFKRLLTSLVEQVGYGVALVGIAFVFQLLSGVIAYFGTAIPADITTAISIGTFILLFLKGTLLTLFDLLDKFKNKFEIADNVDYTAARNAIANLRLDDPAEMEPQNTEFFDGGDL